MSNIARRSLRQKLLLSVMVPASLLAASLGVAQAQGANDSVDQYIAQHELPTYSRIAAIPVPGSPLLAFDISAVDRRVPLYYLADRSNAGLDIFDTKNNTFITRVGGFTGVRQTNGKANNDISGPDGVQPVGLGEIWVGDGDSSVKIVDLFSLSIVDTISTVRTDEAGHTADTDKRADEMSYDPKDQIMVVANNAASPPFLTLISTRPDSRKVIGHMVFSDAAGLEASVYDPQTGYFYVNLTQVGPDPNNGAIAVIDPVRQMEVKRFPVTGCNGAGLVLGPRQNLLVGCSLTNNSQLISARDGSLLAEFPEVSGSDQIWYNPGDENYYLAARYNPASAGGPSLGIINARNNYFVANLPTSVSAHSVAADPHSNHIFVPLGPNPADPKCTNGCIGVYAGKVVESHAEEVIESLFGR